MHARAVAERGAVAARALEEPAARPLALEPGAVRRAVERDDEPLARVAEPRARELGRRHRVLRDRDVDRDRVRRGGQRIPRLVGRRERVRQRERVALALDELLVGVGRVHDDLARALPAARRPLEPRRVHLHRAVRARDVERERVARPREQRDRVPVARRTDAPSTLTPTVSALDRP